MNNRPSKPIKAEIIADFDNLNSVGDGFDDEELNPIPAELVNYNPFEQYAEILEADKKKQKFVKKVRTSDRKKTEQQFRDDLAADKHKALRALREILEDPNSDAKEKVAAAKTLFSVIDHQRDMDIKEKANEQEDVREKAKIIIASQIKTEEMTKALSGIAPLLTSAKSLINEETDED